MRQHKKNRYGPSITKKSENRMPYLSGIIDDCSIPHAVSAWPASRLAYSARPSVPHTVSCVFFFFFGPSFFPFTNTIRSSKVANTIYQRRPAAEVHNVRVANARTRSASVRIWLAKVRETRGRFQGLRYNIFRRKMQIIVRVFSRYCSLLASFAPRRGKTTRESTE